MKKIVALIVTLIMMLSASACAAGVEISMSSFTLIQNNEAVMQLPDPGVRLAFADNGEAMGLRAALVTDGQTVLEAVITLGAEKLMARATGISDIYAVNVAQVMAIVVPYLENIGSLLPAGMEFTEADMAIVGELTSAAQSAVEKGLYYSEDGATMGVKIGAEDVRTLWGLVLQLVANHPEVLEQRGLAVEDVSAFNLPEGFSVDADASISYTDNGMAAKLVINVAEGANAASVELNFSTDAASYANIGFAFKDAGIITLGADAVLSIANTDGAWLIAEDSASVDVFSMTGEQMEKLMTEAQGILSMFGLA